MKVWFQKCYEENYDIQEEMYADCEMELTQEELNSFSAAQEAYYDWQERITNESQPR